MKKMFNIKKISFMIFTFLCIFFATKNVDAAGKYVCYYYDNSYKSPIYIQLKYENGTAKFSYFNYQTKQEVNKYMPTEGSGDYNTYTIESSSASSITTDDFKNGCPSYIHSIENYGNTGSIDPISFTYDIYKGKKITECGSRCKTINEYHYEGYTYEENAAGEVTKTVTCNYSNDNITPAATHVVLEYDTTKNTFNVILHQPAGVTTKPQFTMEDLKKYNGGCPEKLYASIPNYDKFYINNPGGNNTSFSRIQTVSFQPEVKPMTGCARLGGLTKYLTMAFNLLRFLIPLIIIVFSVIDFLSVVVSGENEKMEKAKKKFIIRLIAGILVLFVPFILELLFKLAGIMNNNESLTDVVCNIF